MHLKIGVKNPLQTNNIFNIHLVLSFEIITEHSHRSLLYPIHDLIDSGSAKSYAKPYYNHTEFFVDKKIHIY